MRNVKRRTVAAVAALVLATLGPSAAGGVARAQTEADRQKIEDQIGSLQSQITEASAEEGKLIKAIDASQATKKELDGKVATIDGQISVVQRSLSAATAKLETAKAEQRGAEERLATAQQELAAARNRLAAYAVAAYTGQSAAIQYLTATIKARSIDELVAKRTYMKAVGENQSEIVATDERLRDEVKDLTVVLSAATKEADAQAKVVEGQRAELEVKRDAQDAARHEVAAEIATTDSLRAEVVARKDEFLAEQRELQAQSAAIEAQLRARAEAQRAAAAAANGSPSLAPAPGGFVRPVAGPITSPFGYRIHPIYGTSLLHAGVDIGASSGTAIRAAQAGQVVTSGWMSGYGNVVILDHGGGITTLYAHQSSLGVSEGAKVAQGQTVGFVGCTGSCTGPHLHFEVRVNGSPVDPLRYIG